MPRLPLGRAIRRAFRLDLHRADLARRDLDDEIRLHLELRAEQLARRGLSPEAARAEAAQRFGTPAEVRALHEGAARAVRRRRLGDHLASLGADLIHSARQLRRTPGFTAAVVATFALAIGANATMFAVVDRLLLRPPAHVVAPGQVGRIYLTHDFAGSDYAQAALGYAHFAVLRDGSRTLRGVAAIDRREVTLGHGADARRGAVSYVTGGFFSLLGTRPALGRLLGPDDDRAPDGQPVAVLAWRAWQRDFGGDPGVLGRTIEVAGARFTVVGVAPRGFTGVELSPSEAWVPLSANARQYARNFGDDWRAAESAYWLSVVARRRDGVSDARVNAELNALVVRAYTHPSHLAVERPRLSIEPSIMERGPNRGVWASVALSLVGVSAVVLLVACANVANLLLSRGLRRSREIAVRVALGVGGARLLRQLAAESLLLAAFGGALGVLLAAWGGRALGTLLAPQLDWAGAPVDGRVLAVAALATVACGVLAGLSPALHALRQGVAAALAAGARASTGPSRLRAALLVVQATLCAALLVGAGLFVRSLANVRAVDLGFDADRVIVAYVSTDGAALTDAAADALRETARERLAALPFVESVARGGSVPFWSSMSVALAVPGWDSLPSFAGGGPYVSAATPDYFRTMGVRLLRGRAFGPDDARPGAPRVAVVNETMARALWPGRDALGACLRVIPRGRDTPCSEVVGVVHDTHRNALREDAAPQFLVPAGQAGLDAHMLFVRTRGPATAEAALRVRRELQALRADLPYPEVQRLGDFVDGQTRPWRLGAAMFTAFGALALVLAALGLHSVLAYDVAQRTRELGVRLALGAQAARVTRDVVGRGVALVALGVALGLGAAAGLARWVAPLLFGVAPRDPLVLAAVAAVLLAVAALASALPARRAARVDPAVTLRAD